MVTDDKQTQDELGPEAEQASSDSKYSWKGLAILIGLFALLLLGIGSFCAFALRPAPVEEYPTREQKAQASQELRKEWRRFTSSRPKYDENTLTGMVGVCDHVRQMDYLITYRGADADIVDGDYALTLSKCKENMIPTMPIWKEFDVGLKKFAAIQRDMECGKDCP